MRGRSKRLLVFLFLLISIIGASPLHAAKPASVVLRQVVAENAQGTLYFDVLDRDDKAILNTTERDIRVFFDDAEASVELLSLFSEAKEGLAALFVLDVSKSMNMEHLERAKEAIEGWIDRMSLHDRVGLLSFGERVEVLSPFSGKREKLYAAINRLEQLERMDNGTQLGDALLAAYKMMLEQSAYVPRRRAIILLSDGIQETAGDATGEEILEAMKRASAPLYVIAPAHVARNAVERRLIDSGRRTLTAYAAASGGAFYQGGASRISDFYPQLWAQIQNGYVAIVMPPKAATGGFHFVRVEYPEAGLVSNALDVGYLSFAGGWRAHAVFIFAILAGATLLTIFAIWFARKRRRGKAAQTSQAVAKAIGVAKEKESAAIGGNEEMKEAVPPQNERISGPVGAAGESARADIRTKPRGVEVTLTPVGSHDADSYRVSIRDRVEIGRAKNCAVRISDDATVSGRHCEISWSEGALYLRDLGSSNGTSVNGVPIKGLCALQMGDVLGVGRVALRLANLREA